MMTQLLPRREHSEESSSIDFNFLDRAQVVFQYLFIGWLSRRGDSHYVYSLNH
jgi:hypothetical protein